MKIEVISMIKILIVEDDLEIQRILKYFLEENDYGVNQAYDGIQAIETIDDTIDLVLLDVMLPKIDGFAVLEIIRNRSNIPVIMITALGSEKDQLRGFDLQVDDYVTKPFSIPILIKKIEAVLRRVNKTEQKILTYKDLQIDFDGMYVTVNNNEVKLTVKEFEIVCEMFMNQGIVLTRELLATKLWGDETFCDDRIINIHIKNIRQKLGVDYIKTVRGAGYKIEKLC